MTRKKLESLARRAVACKRWRWMPGMAVLPLTGLPNRVVSVETGVVYEEVETYPSEMAHRLLGHHWCGQWRECGMLPDLSDPATMGCLLALVRKAWNDEYACALPVDYRPHGIMLVCRLAATGWPVTRSVWSTEAEALVAALEAAP